MSLTEKRTKPSGPDTLWNTACFRETLTSSKKISLLLARPTLVWSASSKKRDPAWGPRLTMSKAQLAGSSEIARPSEAVRSTADALRSTGAGAGVGVERNEVKFMDRV